MANSSTHYQDLPIRSDALQRRALAHQHFDVLNLPVGRQLLAWRERMGSVTDVVPSRHEMERPFRASIDRYDVGEFMFADCYTDPLTLDRTIARISRDNVRSVVFHLFVDGTGKGVLTHTAKRSGVEIDCGILAVDLDHPVRLVRGACRHITIFVPGVRLGQVFPDPGALHGRLLSPQMPLVRYLVGRAVSLAAHMPFLAAERAYDEVSEIVDLLLEAYGEEAGIKGGQRATARALAFDGARRYVRTHLADADLTPEQVVSSLGLSRPSLYRLFQHEGGLGAYIRHLRLRTAASELVAFPGLAVQDIAYAVGFKSASDFTRAFRRAYGVAPQEMRHDVRAVPDKASQL